MVERVGLKKDDNRKKKKQQEIAETPMSKAKERYIPSEEPSNQEEVKEEPTEEESRTTHKRGRGRPKSSKTTRMARLSIDNVNRLNALKETLSVYNQDEVVSSAIKLLEDSLSNREKRLYKLFLDVQETRSRKRR